MGQFVGSSPNYYQIQSAAILLWGRKGKVDVMSMEKEVFLFNFHDIDTKSWVLNSGHWYIGQIPLFLRNYVKSMSIDKLCTIKFPKWMKLCGIPLILCNVLHIRQKSKKCSPNTNPRSCKWVLAPLQTQKHMGLGL